MPLYPQIVSHNTGWSLSAEPRLGMVYGSLGEYLYMEKSDGTWKKNSYLEWEEKPLCMVGIGINGGYRNFHLQTCIDAALPLHCGSMMDSDWKLAASPDVKTNYSIHENTAATNIRTGLSLSCDFSPHSHLIISPVAEVNYIYRSFEARNGEGWYGDTVSWDDPSAKHYPGTYDGKKYILGAIDYRHHTFQLFTGLQFTFLIRKNVCAGLGLFVSPYSYVFAEDRHYSNKARTTGRYYVYKSHSHFTRYKAQIFARSRLTRFLEVGLTADAITSDIENADMYDEDPTTEKIYRTNGYKGGFSLSEISVKVSVKVHIF